VNRSKTDGLELSPNNLYQDLEVGQEDVPISSDVGPDVPPLKLELKDFSILMRNNYSSPQM
jgi:hypothetical protein